MKKKYLLARIEFLEKAVGELMVQLAALRGSIAAVPFVPQQPAPPIQPFPQHPMVVPHSPFSGGNFGHQSRN